MPVLHTLLAHEMQSLNFTLEDFEPLRVEFPDLTIEHHSAPEHLQPRLKEVELLVTWEFEQAWFAKAPKLKAVFTPAAGDDWVVADLKGRVTTHYGTFHGPLLAESLLGAILYLNRKTPEMVENQRRKQWDRDIQADTQTLAGQTVLIIGYGSIGQHCARLLRACGARVLGYRRSATEGKDADTGASFVAPSGLKKAILAVDHLVLLLPGGRDSDRFMTPELLSAMKHGSRIYNFGRGNCLREKDLLPFIDSGQISGAVLDVVEKEPLPLTSRLWDHPRVLVTPHTSCAYSEYTSLYIKELIRVLDPYLRQGPVR